MARAWRGLSAICWLGWRGRGAGMARAWRGHCSERPIQSQQAPGGSPNQPQRAFQAPNGGNEYRLIRRP
eukprot:gene20037-biopygen17552